MELHDFTTFARYTLQPDRAGGIQAPALAGMALERYGDLAPALISCGFTALALLVFAGLYPGPGGAPPPTPPHGKKKLS